MFCTLARDMLRSIEKSQWPSCEIIVMNNLNAIVKASEKDFAEFPPGYNYEELAYEAVRLEVTMGDNPYKAEDFPMYVAKRDAVSPVIRMNE